MKDLFIVLGFLLTTIARILRPGGARAIVAESLLLKQQLLGRPHHRAPIFSALDRFLFGFWALPLGERRIPRVAVILRPPTLLSFHDAIEELGVAEIKTGPTVPLSHPFVERLAGTTRRQFLDHALFWNAEDLERKPRGFKEYYNGHRVHASLRERTPLEVGDGRVMRRADPRRLGWETHRRGLFELPMAA
jgi:hypothetical protein